MECTEIWWDDWSWLKEQSIRFWEWLRNTRATILSTPNLHKFWSPASPILRLILDFFPRIFVQCYSLCCCIRTSKRHTRSPSLKHLFYTVFTIGQTACPFLHRSKACKQTKPSNTHLGPGAAVTSQQWLPLSPKCRKIQNRAHISREIQIATRQ